MQVCNYCGRNLKQHYEICPGCGSNSFTEKRDMGESYVIETPPKGGYKLNMESLKGQQKFLGIFKYFGIGFLVISAIMIFPFFIVPFMTGVDNAFGISWLLFLIGFITMFAAVPIIMIVIFGNMSKKCKKDMERLNRLAQTGILIKNIPYKVVGSGYQINSNNIQAIQVVYETPEGKKLTLRSNPKFDGRVYDTDGLADLLIDPNDHSNYYIDIEIY